MVRISIPTLPPAPHVPANALTLLPTRLAAAHLASFLEAGQGRTLMITGAGVSVDSGIRAYRGKEGHYSNPNYKFLEMYLPVRQVLMKICRPILYHELVEDTTRGEMFRCETTSWSSGSADLSGLLGDDVGVSHLLVSSQLISL